MAQPSYAAYTPSPYPVSVIGSQFIAPYPFEAIIVINSSGDLLITEVNHKILFKVKPCNRNYHNQRVLLDVDDRPIVLMREKKTVSVVGYRRELVGDVPSLVVGNLIVYGLPTSGVIFISNGYEGTNLATEYQQPWTVHNGWKVFKGDSKADSDLIFSTKTPKIIQSKTNVHVFLGSNTCNKGICDFKITGSWSKRSCTIYVGDSSTIIAQMHKMEPPESVGFVKDKFMVTIYPYVDYAFVVTLIAIVEAMNSSDADDDVIEEVIGSVFG